MSVIGMHNATTLKMFNIAHANEKLLQLLLHAFEGLKLKLISTPQGFISHKHLQIWMETNNNLLAQVRT